MQIFVSSFLHFDLNDDGVEDDIPKKTLLLLLLARLINRLDVVLGDFGRRSPLRFHCYCGQRRYRRHDEAENRSSIAGIGRSAAKKSDFTSRESSEVLVADSVDRSSFHEEATSTRTMAPRSSSLLPVNISSYREILGKQWYSIMETCSAHQ